MEATTTVTTITFDLDVLAETDTYIAELLRKGVKTNRSALVNAALTELIQRRRAEEAGEDSDA